MRLHRLGHVRGGMPKWIQLWMERELHVLGLEHQVERESDTFVVR